MKTVTGLFDTYEDASDVVGELVATGVPHSDISIVANNSDNWYSDDTSKTADGATAGAGSAPCGWSRRIADWTRADGHTRRRAGRGRWLARRNCSWSSGRGSRGRCCWRDRWRFDCFRRYRRRRARLCRGGEAWWNASDRKVSDDLADEAQRFWPRQVCGYRTASYRFSGRRLEPIQRR